MNPITKSSITDKEKKHVSRHKKSSSDSIISRSSKKRSYNKSNSDNNRSQEDENEIGLKQCKVLKVVSTSKEHDTDQKSIHNKTEDISKHDLNTTKSTSIAQNLHQINQLESASPNNELFRNKLTNAQQNKASAGAIKTYFDTKKCNITDKQHNNKNLKPKNEKMKTGCTVQRKHTDSNVKTNIERQNNSNRQSEITSNVQKSKRKGYEDKKESCKLLNNRNERKNKTEDYNEISTEPMKKKEELKNKFTSYCQKRNNKSTESNLNKNKIDTDKRFAKHSDLKKKHGDEIIASPKHKVQKEKAIRKSFDNSEKKRMEEVTNRKVNKNEESGLKRKLTGSEQGGTKKYYKRDSVTIIDTSQNKPHIESRSLPTRTVDVIEKSGCFNLQNSCKDKNDQWSKLNRKRTKNKSNTESSSNKLTPSHENSIVTVKQDVPTTVPKSGNQSLSKEKVKKIKIKRNIHSLGKKEEVKKPEDKKSKNIKLVINIQFLNSDGFEEIVSETSTSPHEDLSFLDDLDIEGIVDSLKADQGSIADSKIGNEEDLERGSNKITEDMSIIYISDDSQDEIKLLNKLNNENEVTVISETNEDAQNVIADQNKKDVNNIKDIVNNDADQPEVKYSASTEDVVEAKNTEQEVPQTEDSNIKIRSNDENTKIINNNHRIKSENLEELQNVSISDSNVQELPIDVDNNTSIIMKYEKIDANIVKTENIEIFQKVLTSPSSTQEQILNNNKDNTVIHTKNAPIENVEKSPKVLTSDPNVLQQMCNGVGAVITAENIQKEKLDTIVTSEDIESDLTTSSNIQKQYNTAINTKTELIANMHTTITNQLEGSSVTVQPNINPKNHNKIIHTLDIHTNGVKLMKTRGKKRRGKKKKIPTQVKHTKSEVEVITPVKSETIAIEVLLYWSKIEQRMLEYLQRKFTITKTIHTGHFSSIYKCTEVNGGTYAIKVLKRIHPSTGIYKDNMLTNLQKNSDKNQYFLLEMISKFDIHGEWCFVSEYYPKTLAEFLAQGSKRKPRCFYIDVVQNLSRQLVAAVCTLTRNQLVHSDIKPTHILLNSSYTRLRLCGFDRMNYNNKLKVTGRTGTASYRAPEIIMGFKADYKIDVWSTALVMFEMASGFKLFPGCFNNDILFKQITTLGPVPDDMIKNSTHAFKYFYGSRFMKQIGPSDWIFVSFRNENHRIHNGPYTSYQNTWAHSRSQKKVTEDLHKLEMLHRLLQIMLVMDPRHRIPITDVVANEFIYHH